MPKPFLQIEEKCKVQDYQVHGILHLVFSSPKFHKHLFYLILNRKRYCFCYGNFATHFLGDQVCLKGFQIYFYIFFSLFLLSLFLFFFPAIFLFWKRALVSFLSSSCEARPIWSFLPRSPSTFPAKRYGGGDPGRGSQIVRPGQTPFPRRPPPPLTTGSGVDVDDRRRGLRGFPL